MIFYDFEVFKYDWLVVLMDMTAKQTTVLHNDRDGLQAFYDGHNSDIWVGYNSRHYDIYILKGILLGMDPKVINDEIIVNGIDGWKIVNGNNIQLYNFDIMPNPPVGLKTLEGFMASDIRETEVPFNIDRPLTDSELAMTEKYCRHDVEETVKVFMQRADQFNAMMAIVKAFSLPLSCIGMTEAQITARVLECSRRDWTDEFDLQFFPCIKLDKYQAVMDWFQERAEEAQSLQLGTADPFTKKKWYDGQSFKCDVAGVPHVFGFGGLHGAPDHPLHTAGQILHVDVNNYYPSMLNAYGIVTRAAGAPERYLEIYNTRKQLKMLQVQAKESGDGKKAKEYKKAQLPYKKMLNALSGAMKDRYNPAYDPRNNNIMCVNGQLMMLDLIEKLEIIDGFQLIQTNTDGLIIQVPDTDAAFYQVDDICWEWEQRVSTDKCSIRLELDAIREIYQKDVNNYIWIDIDGSTERKGAYLKELSPIDYDLPIVNKALVDYMVKRAPIEQTIRGCDELVQFQKIVKLSNKYKWTEHNGVKSVNNSYRVFASTDPADGRLYKCGGKRGKPEKFGNTPDSCFIVNDSVAGKAAHDYPLDKDWYIKLAKKRLKDYGL